MGGDSLDGFHLSPLLKVNLASHLCGTRRRQATQHMWDPSPVAGMFAAGQRLQGNPRPDARVLGFGQSRVTHVTTLLTAMKEELD